MKLLSRAAVVWIVLVLAGCGSETVVTHSSPAASGTLIGGTGPLPGAIRGVHYQSGDLQGFTAADGRFEYQIGHQVVFSIGDLEFQPVDGAAWVSPFQLANGSGCAAGAPLARVAQLLQSLDADGNPDNGLAFRETPAPARRRAVNELSTEEIVAAVQAARPGAETLPAAVALARFIRQVDDEDWSLDSTDIFQIFDALVRSQGVTTDGSSWFFSARFHLQRTSLDYHVEVENPDPIPPDINALGGNHIGDIDTDQGLLYAPIEDGPAYLHSFIVTYDAQTLLPTGNQYPLPHELTTKGVPWVAVDGPRKVVYTGEWDPTLQINAFDRDHDLAYLYSIVLDPAIGRIQGAKVFNGAMYASSDNDNKSVYKIDLDTGTVMELFRLGTPTSEAEGLALTADDSGVHANVLNILLPTVHFEHWLRTRAPLRDKLCGSP